MNQFPNFTHCLFQADKDGTGNNGMSNIQVCHVRQTGYGLNVVAMQTMTGIDLQAQVLRLLGPVDRCWGRTVKRALRPCLATEIRLRVERGNAANKIPTAADAANSPGVELSLSKDWINLIG